MASAHVTTARSPTGWNAAPLQLQTGILSAQQTGVFQQIHLQGCYFPKRSVLWLNLVTKLMETMKQVATARDSLCRCDLLPRLPCFLPWPEASPTRLGWSWDTGCIPARDKTPRASGAGAPLGPGTPPTPPGAFVGRTGLAAWLGAGPKLVAKAVSQPGRAAPASGPRSTREQRAGKHRLGSQHCSGSRARQERGPRNPTPAAGRRPGRRRTKAGRGQAPGPGGTCALLPQQVGNPTMTPRTSRSSPDLSGSAHGHSRGPGAPPAEAAPALAGARPVMRTQARRADGECPGVSGEATTTAAAPTPG